MRGIEMAALAANNTRFNINTSLWYSNCNNSLAPLALTKGSTYTRRMCHARPSQSTTYEDKRCLHQQRDYLCNILSSADKYSSWPISHNELWNGRNAVTFARRLIDVKIVLSKY